jgi:hypothetical protein
MNIAIIVLSVLVAGLLLRMLRYSAFREKEESVALKRARSKPPATR